MASADPQSAEPATGGAHPLIVVVGPTGTGKTDLSLHLAERIRETGGDAEVVNADAMQFYRGMDIGTAKLPPAEWRGIPHHLIDILDVTDEATVARYQPTARAVIGQILERGAVPILVGGSGLYVSSVIFDLRFPGTDAGIRERLEAELDAQGPGLMYRRLAELDPPPPPPSVRATGGGSSERSKSSSSRGSRSAPPSPKSRPRGCRS